MTDCRFHAHKGDDPCPHCIEAGGTKRNAKALPFDMSTKSYRIPGRNAWADDCPDCATTDLRINTTKSGVGAVWCSQCGAQASLIDRTLGFIRSMRGVSDVSHVVGNERFQRSVRTVD